MESAPFPDGDPSDVPRNRLPLLEDSRLEDDDVEREAPATEEGANPAAHLQAARSLRHLHHHEQIEVAAGPTLAPGRRSEGEFARAPSNTQSRIPSSRALRWRRRPDGGRERLRARRGRGGRPVAQPSWNASKKGCSRRSGCWTTGSPWKRLRPRKGSSAPSSPSARSPTASERGFIRSPTAMAGPPGCGPTGAPCATACRCSSASDHAPRDRSTPRPPPIRWPVITAPPFRSSPRGWRSGSERGRGAEWTGLPPSALCRRPPRNGSSRPSGRPP